MLAIRKSKRHQGTCVPNVLPCKISHNGSVNASKKYWNPLDGKHGKKVAYFRGRKLYGRSVKIPAGYKGVVMLPTEETLIQDSPIEESMDDEDEEEKIDVEIVKELAEFDEIMVWGHEVMPNEQDDPYVRGIREWVTFAEQVHSYPKDGQDFAEKKV